MANNDALANKASAIIKLNTTLMTPGDFVSIRYKNPDGSYDSMVAVGLKSGVGPDCYSIISSQGIMTVFAILTEIPPFSAVVHGEVYIYHDLSDKYWKISIESGNLRKIAITESFYFNNLQDGCFYYYDSTRNKLYNITENFVSADEFNLTRNKINSIYEWCVSQGMEELPEDDITYVDTISINKGSRLSLLENESVILTASILPGYATDKKVIWSSTDSSVAEVTASGIVYARSIGETTIRVEAADGHGAYAEIVISVEKKKIFVSSIEIITEDNVEVKEEETLGLSVVVLPLDATNSEVSYESSNPEIATVDANGYVTGVAEGATRITVTTLDGSGLTDDIDIVVTPKAIKVESIEFTEEFPETLNMGGDTINLNDYIVILPENADNKNIEWSVDDTNVAEIEEGILTTKHDGTITITAHALGGEVDDITKELEIKRVVVPVTSLVVEGERNITLLENDTYQIECSVLPENATFKGITFTSTNKQVIDVTESGKVTAYEIGSASIIITAKGGGNPVELKFNVLEKLIYIDSISFTEAELEINVKTETDLKDYLSITPEDATALDYVWKTNHKSIVSVSEEGIAKAEHPGDATITVYSRKNPEITASINIVSKTIPVTDFRLKDVEDVIELEVGNKITLEVDEDTIYPEVNTNPGFIWTSGNSSIISVNRSTGECEAKGLGETYVLVMAKDGENATVLANFKVLVKTEGVDLFKKNLSLMVGKSEVLTATIIPEDATNTDLTWSSSDEDVAVVDETGKVTAVSVGTAVITVTTSAGLSDTCNVTISAPIISEITVTGVEDIEATNRIYLGSTVQLSVEFSPSGSLNTAANWVSSNPEVISVDETGLVTAVGDKFDQGYRNASIIVNSVESPSVFKEIKFVLAAPVVDGITLDETEFDILIGETKTLVATVSPELSKNKSLTWSSSDEDVATVDENGEVTAVSPGEATITVTSVESPEVSAECSVIVGRPNVESVQIADDEDQEIEIVIGTTRKLNVSVLPEGANQQVTWNSNSDDVVSVEYNGDGTITAESLGIAKVYVRSVANRSKAVVFDVTVVNPPASGVVISDDTLALTVGESYKISALVSPENANNKNVVWSTDDEDGSILTIDNEGNISAIGVGTAKVTVTTEEGNYTDECDVTISPRVESINITGSKTILTLESEDTEVELSAEVLPEGSNSEITWSSSNEEIAVVDESGKVTAVSKGEVIITAKSNEVPFEGDEVITGTYNITVKNPKVTGISISNESLNLIGGKGANLTCTIEPENAEVQDVIWTSSDTDVVTVDGGLVIAQNVDATSTATISVKTAEEGSTIEEATCVVTVVPAVSSVEITTSAPTLTVGEDTTLDSLIQPSDANQNVIWSVDNEEIATIDEDGKVTAISKGTAIVTATSVENEGKTATIQVTVLNPKVNEVKFVEDALPETLNLYVEGEDGEFNVSDIITVGPELADDKSVTWSIDNTDLASVEEVDGVLKIKTFGDEGEFVLTATSVESGEVSASKTINIEYSYSIPTESGYTNFDFSDVVSDHATLDFPYDIKSTNPFGSEDIDIQISENSYVRLVFKVRADDVITGRGLYIETEDGTVYYAYPKGTSVDDWTEPYIITESGDYYIDLTNIDTFRYIKVTDQNGISTTNDEPVEGEEPETIDEVLRLMYIYLSKRKSIGLGSSRPTLGSTYNPNA